MNSQADLPIGVYDSGIGGLSIALAIRRHLPHERLIYFADSAFAPYGCRGDDWLVNRVMSISHFLACQPVKAIVLACNTATTNAINTVRANLDIPVIGTEPAIRVAAQHSKQRRIALMATQRTIASRRARGLHQMYGSTLNMHLQGCPGLADSVERGELNTPHTRSLVNTFVSQALSHNPDVLLLGCTHYRFLVPHIQYVAGPSVQLIWPEHAIAKQLARRLYETQTLKLNCHSGGLALVSSGCLPTTRRLARMLTRSAWTISAPC